MAARGRQRRVTGASNHQSARRRCRFPSHHRYAVVYTTWIIIRYRVWYFNKHFDRCFMIICCTYIHNICVYNAISRVDDLILRPHYYWTSCRRRDQSGQDFAKPPLQHILLISLLRCISGRLPATIGMNWDETLSIAALCSGWHQRRIYVMCVCVCCLCIYIFIYSYNKTNMIL